MSSTVSILSAFPWYAWIPIAAIIGGSAVAIVKALTTHQERMAMIRQGIHPDSPVAKPFEQSEV
jgi:hypothetical protein